MHFKVILWDMDGVLIDSEPLYNDADAALFADLGLPFGQKEIAALTGVSYHIFGRLMREWYPHLPHTQDELSSIYVKSLMDALRHGDVQLQPGVKAWMQRAQTQGIKMAIASSSTREMVNFVIERLGLAPYLSAVVTGDDVTQGKPFPDIFLKAAEQLDAVPSECLVIEDSTNGIKAALSAGMTCVAYTATNRHRLDQSQAHGSLAAFDDIAWAHVTTLCRYSP
ncbi:MAG: HAD family phosphatase [Oscillospiraceae bacterium]|nr:HAD family phosphatase [Oscillospiraceae bacterium]